MLQTIAGQQVFAFHQGEGPQRLFLHCSLATHQSLIRLSNALPAARDIFIDLPGHGRSGAWQGEDYQTDTLRIAEAMLDGAAHVIGHSFGATVALRLAAERPELVSRLTLIEPVMFAAVTDGAIRAKHAAANAPFTTAWAAGDREAATKAFLKLWGAGQAWEDIPAPMRARFKDQIHLIAAAAPAIEDDVHRVMERLDNVTCPVDLIEGSESQPIMAAILDALQEQLAQARRHSISGAGHMAPISHVNEVAEILRD